MKGTSRGRSPSGSDGRPQQAGKTRPVAATRETFSRFIRNLAKLEGERGRSGKGEAHRE